MPKTKNKGAKAPAANPSPAEIRASLPASGSENLSFSLPRTALTGHPTVTGHLKTSNRATLKTQAPQTQPTDIGAAPASAMHRLANGLPAPVLSRPPQGGGAIAQFYARVAPPRALCRPLRPSRPLAHARPLLRARQPTVCAYPAQSSFTALPVVRGNPYLSAPALPLSAFVAQLSAP